MSEDRRQVWTKKRSKKDKQHRTNNTLKKDRLKNKKQEKYKDIEENRGNHDDIY